MKNPTVHPFKVIHPAKEKASNYFMETTDRNGKSWYIVMESIGYWSRRYSEWIILKQYFTSDGATGAYDINSFGWLFHDKLCNTGTFYDGTRCTNWQASSVCSDILDDEGRWFRRWSWKYMTFAFGGGKARKNGMFSLS